MNIQQQVTELNTMIRNGQIMDAFEKFYHMDVVMQENNNEPTVGKDANRERELKAVAQQMEMLEALHSAEAVAVTTGDDVSMVEWEMDMTIKGGPRIKKHQVAVQRWQDGQIISEKFYYSQN